jgi:hypothetical protein
LYTITVEYTSRAATDAPRAARAPKGDSGTTKGGETVAVGLAVGEAVGLGLDEVVQVFVTVFEVTAAFFSFKKLAVIVSVPAEPPDV